ncbi:hypothetical protein E2C01_034320 [Portunus trituberculatus]|uniref:Uncharacterized protein n=1 Tax=Portunus trituberculatus TaxID=210409 RepID=A0A5B7F882_PORTR|nr:hypothetical protein [Portunus trituberculatus]
MEQDIKLNIKSFKPPLTVTVARAQGQGLVETCRRRLAVKVVGSVSGRPHEHHPCGTRLVQAEVTAGAEAKRIGASHEDVIHSERIGTTTDISCWGGHGDVKGI